MKKGSF